ncbi:MAG: hypothetical protein JNK05_35875 [Myxococcales bacterium]|nr:hypothetical protein [Myxococcales bacterium]
MTLCPSGPFAALGFGEARLVGDLDSSGLGLGGIAWMERLNASGDPKRDDR